MPNLTSKAVIIATFLSFSFGGFVWAQNQAQAEQNLEQKLGGKQKKEKKNKKPEIKTPVLDQNDPSISDHDKRVNLLARQIELEKQLKEVKKEKRKVQSDAEREAERRVSRDEKRQANWEEDTRGAIINAHVDGCEDGSVWVRPGATEIPYGFNHSRVIAINRSGVPVNIRETQGVLGGKMVVKILCPGGSLSLSQRLDFNGQNQVGYEATGSGPLGQGGTSQSPVIFIPYCGGSPCQAEYSANWEIRLN